MRNKRLNESQEWLQGKYDASRSEKVRLLSEAYKKVASRLVGEWIESHSGEIEIEEILSCTVADESGETIKALETAGVVKKGVKNRCEISLVAGGVARFTVKRSYETLSDEELNSYTDESIPFDFQSDLKAIEAGQHWFQEGYDLGDEEAERAARAKERALNNADKVARAEESN